MSEEDIYANEGSTVEHEDGTATFTIKLSVCANKAFKYDCKDPVEWVRTAIYAKTFGNGKRIFENEIERYKTIGKAPEDFTEKGIILNAVMPDHNKEITIPSFLTP